jgi:autotransporter-associated beta strand protein
MKIRSNFLFNLISLILLSIALTQNAYATDITWDGSSSSSWNDTDNWQGGAVPNGASDSAVFDTTSSGNHSVTINTTGSYQIAGINITGGVKGSPSTYTFTVSSGSAITLSGTGIDNSSGLSVSFTNQGGMTFTNSASISNVTITNDQGGTITFMNSASAGNATLINNLNPTSPGSITFDNTATAATATITNTWNYGSITFNNNAQAGSATISNAANCFQGHIIFNDTTSAGSATLVNASNSLGGASNDITFNDSASADDATILNSSSTSSVIFNDSSTAADATITNNGTVSFNNSATAANTVITNTGTVNFNNSATAGNTTINGGTVNFLNSANAGTDAADPVHINNAVVTFGTSGGSDTSSAGDAIIALNSSSSLTFNAATSAGNAQITNNGSSSGIAFRNSATAANATITDTNGNLIFGTSGGNATATAGAATITNNGTGSVIFFANTSAGNAQITNNVTDDESGIFFNNSATAANATITNNSGIINFSGQATAGTATLINNGGTIIFEQNSNVTTIGTPTIVSNSGTIDFSNLSDKTLTLNSLSGTGGTINIGDNLLQVGAGNTNTVFDGNIISAILPNTDVGDAFSKVGSGSLTLNGSNTFTGGATVAGGTLVIGDSSHTSASLTGDVVIQSAGTLEGYGTINGNVTNAGTISPGDSSIAENLTINGNYTQSAGGVYLAQIDAQGDSDHLTINGTANLNGNGTVNLTAFNNQVTVGQTYTFLTAQNINGRFSGVVQSPYLTGQLVYTPTTVGYILNYNNATIDHDGTIYANQMAALAQIGNWFDNKLDDRMLATNNLNGDGAKLWVAAQDGYDQLFGSGDTSGLNTNLHGVAIGSDLALSNKTTIGAALGLTNFSQSATAQESASSNGNLYQLGAYIHHALARWRFGAEASYGFTDAINTKRFVQEDTGTVQTTGSYHADVWSVRGKVGYAIPLSSTLYHVQPFVGMIGQQVNREGFSESGIDSSGVSLDVKRSTYQSLRSQLGIGADAAPFTNSLIKLFGTVGWEHEYADTHGEFDANLVNVSGNSFTVNGTDIGRDAAVAQAGIKIPLFHNRLALAAIYQGRFAHNLRENLGLLQIGYSL